MGHFVTKLLEWTIQTYNFVTLLKEQMELHFLDLKELLDEKETEDKI